MRDLEQQSVSKKVITRNPKDRSLFVLGPAALQQRRCTPAARQQDRLSVTDLQRLETCALAVLRHEGLHKADRCLDGAAPIGRGNGGQLMRSRHPGLVCCCRSLQGTVAH